MQSAEIARRMAGLPVFRPLTDEERERLAQVASVRRLRADEHLWRAGDEASAMTVVLRGLLEIRRPAPGGEEALLALFGPREPVGLTAVLERGAYPADAIALSDEVEVLRVPAAAFHDAMDRSPTLARAVQGALIEHSHALRAKIDVLSAGPVPRRLAALLLHLAERFGDEDEQGAVRIPVALSRTRLAHLVAARVETIIRTASRWQKAGWLETGPDGFVVRDPAELRRQLDA